MPGCPIRKSADQRPFAPTRGLSQLVTSFFACESLGIHHTPFTTFARTELTPTKGARSVDYTFSFLFNSCHAHNSTRVHNEKIRFFLFLLSLTICQRSYDITQTAELQTRSANPREGSSTCFSSSFSSERRCSSVCLACGRAAPENPLPSEFSSERRCSSRTFRYGYLVTT